MHFPKKFLQTPLPYDDEVFLSYIIRLARENGVSNEKLIFQEVGLKEVHSTVFGMQHQPLKMRIIQCFLKRIILHLTS